VAVDHFNTGHPHAHIVIRGRDDQGRDLVMARDYIARGVRARAQGLITLELGPETDLERAQKLFKRDRAGAADPARPRPAGARRGRHPRRHRGRGRDPLQQTLRIGRLKTLERLGLAQERQQGVWQLDGKLESKLRRLGDRADKFRTMQQVLKELGIDRGTAAMALFERGPRKVPLIGKVIGVGMVDEITDRTWMVVDAVDGRVHYADLGRLKPTDMPARGMLVALAGDETLRGKPTPFPRV
jgi:type IV secretory pathway VirD2 relaxase